jgi:hypothetical protein
LMPLISRKETEQLFFLKKRTNNLDLARKRTYSLGHLFLSCSFAQNYRSICSTFIPLLPAPPLHGRIEESNFYVCFSLINTPQAHNCEHVVARTTVAQFIKLQQGVA